MAMSTTILTGCSQKTVTQTLHSAVRLDSPLTAGDEPAAPPWQVSKLTYLNKLRGHRVPTHVEKNLVITLQTVSSLCNLLCATACLMYPGSCTVDRMFISDNDSRKWPWSGLRMYHENGTYQGIKIISHRVNSPSPKISAAQFLIGGEKFR